MVIKGVLYLSWLSEINNDILGPHYLSLHVPFCIHRIFLRYKIHESAITVMKDPHAFQRAELTELLCQFLLSYVRPDIADP